MAVTKRGQRAHYDNIAVGAACGEERTIAGSKPPGPVTTQYGALDNIASGTTDIAVENLVAGTTDVVSENVDGSSGTS